MTLLSVLASPARAQKKIVVPGHLAAATGNTGGGLQFSDDPLPRILQQLFHVQPAMAGLVRSIAFRRYFLPTASSAFSVDLAVSMCHATTDMLHPSPYLPANRGPDAVVTMSLRRVSFPMVAAQTSGPYPFTYRLTFDRPFVLQVGRTAMWEMWMGRSTAGTVILDEYALALDASRFDPLKYQINMLGSPLCPGVGDNMISASPTAVGARAKIERFPQVVSSSGAWGLTFVGSQASRWGPHALPLDLSRFGAPGCYIYISLDTALPGFDVSAGSYHMSLLDVPDDARFLGSKVYVQTLTFRTRANRLDLTTSPGLEVLIGPKPNPEATAVASPWPWPAGGLKALGVLGNVTIWWQCVFELGY